MRNLVYKNHLHVMNEVIQLMVFLESKGSEENVEHCNSPVYSATEDETEDESTLRNWIRILRGRVVELEEQLAEERRIGEQWQRLKSKSPVVGKPVESSPLPRGWSTTPSQSLADPNSPERNTDFIEATPPNLTGQSITLRDLSKQQLEILRKECMVELLDKMGDPFKRLEELDAVCDEALGDMARMLKML